VFSPDVKYVAAISEDGCLRVIDALAEQYEASAQISGHCSELVYRLVDCYASYFGALTCVAWSPDGRFILARPLLRAYILATHALLLRLVGRMIC
jgi:WD40 repeat protein